VLGTLLLEVIFRDFVADAPGAASLSFADEMGGWTGALFEGVLTFALVTAYIRTFAHRSIDATLGAFTLGMIVTAAFLVAFALTGGAPNVGRVFGTALVANEWTDFGWYALGMLSGGVAGLVYEYVFQSPEVPEGGEA